MANAGVTCNGLWALRDDALSPKPVLSDAEWRVAVALLSFGTPVSDKAAVAKPGLRRLAAAAHCSRSTLAKALKKLESLGEGPLAVEIKRGETRFGDAAPNEYHLTVRGVVESETDHHPTVRSGSSGSSGTGVPVVESGPDQGGPAQSMGVALPGTQGSPPQGTFEDLSEDPKLKIEEEAGSRAGARAQQPQLQQPSGEAKRGGNPEPEESELGFFEPCDTHINLATRFGMDLEAELSAFLRDNKGRRSADWNSEFTRHLLRREREVRGHGERAPKGPQKPPSGRVSPAEALELVQRAQAATATGLVEAPMAKAGAA